MDQIAALHWLQENVSLFGGDPSNVTLVGHGTGAACVNFLMTSAAVPDGLLFHRAVLMSGSALSPWALVRSPIAVRNTKSIATSVNCSTDGDVHNLLKCLRSKPLAMLLDAAQDGTASQTSSFGPSIDGVVIDSGLTQLKVSTTLADVSRNSEGSFYLRGTDGSEEALQRMIAKLSRYDLILGVVPAESLFVFNEGDMQFGVEPELRSNVLKTYLKNYYRYHLSEILATIINEYTDWERGVQHPVTIRDGTADALSDAQYAAPICQLADLHSSAHKNSYLYVFDYQTKNGDYAQRHGCIHGEELAYIFGAPLVGGLSHFTSNYTKTEILLSETAIVYWSNFARTGSPNGNDSGPKNRFKNPDWAAYEFTHKKYMSLDIKAKIRTHYRAHKLSYWLNLIPELHKAGSPDVPSKHHMFQSDLKSPDQIAMWNSSWSGDKTDSSQSEVTSASVPTVILQAKHENHTSDHSEPPLTTNESVITHSTALLITVSLGCVLLFVNIVVYLAAFCRSRRRHSRCDRRSHRASCRRRKYGENGGSSGSVSSGGSLRETPDLCCKPSAKLASGENGSVKNIVYDLCESEEVPRYGQLPSILKKTRRLSPMFDQPSTVSILLPGENHPESSSVETSSCIEMSSLRYATRANIHGLGRASTMPRPPAPPKVPVLPGGETSGECARHLTYGSGGTLGRRVVKPIDDLRV